MGLKIENVIQQIKSETKVVDLLIKPLTGILMIIIAPRLLPFGGRPAVGFGPKLEEMNPRTFPDLPIRPRTLDFDQKTSKITQKWAP